MRCSGRFLFPLDIVILVVIRQGGDVCYAIFNKKRGGNFYCLSPPLFLKGKVPLKFFLCAEYYQSKAFKPNNVVLQCVVYGFSHWQLKSVRFSRSHDMCVHAPLAVSFADGHFPTPPMCQEQLPMHVSCMHIVNPPTYY